VAGERRAVHRIPGDQLRRYGYPIDAAVRSLSADGVFCGSKALDRVLLSRFGNDVLRALERPCARMKRKAVRRTLQSDVLFEGARTGESELRFLMMRR
jgi:hypothetical protein